MVERGKVHDTYHINELITMMGKDVLSKIVQQSVDPAWFAIIADEATDVTMLNNLRFQFDMLTTTMRFMRT